MKLPSDIFTNELKYLFEILLKTGDELRLVGGCIRNYFLGKKINDYDLATQHEPDQLIDILKKNSVSYLDLNRKFGTITAIINGKKFEITSLRRDIASDGRHAVVKFTRDYLEDAKRRDFTFNALYSDANGVIYDYFDGISDLKKGLIRFIGDPEQRILEDHLRILRLCAVFHSMM